MNRASFVRMPRQSSCRFRRKYRSDAGHFAVNNVFIPGIVIIGDWRQQFLVYMLHKKEVHGKSTSRRFDVSIFDEFGWGFDGTSKAWVERDLFMLVVYRNFLFFGGNEHCQDIPYRLMVTIWVSSRKPYEHRKRLKSLTGGVAREPETDHAIDLLFSPYIEKIQDNSLLPFCTSAIVNVMSTYTI